MKVLEIGPGTPDGKSVLFPNADTVDAHGELATENLIWGQNDLPFDDNVFDLVFASHVLQFVPWYRVVTALREARRVLKPEGELELYVPDFAYIVQCYNEKTIGDDWKLFNDAGGWMTWINGRIFGPGEDATEILKDGESPFTHMKSAFDESYLIARLTDAGFKDIEPISHRRTGEVPQMREVGALAIK